MAKTATKTARDVMTVDPACCTVATTLDQVAKMMVLNDCGEIPVIDVNDQVVGVVTDRDIVCRVVAEGKNPVAYTAETCMSQPVVTVELDDTLDEVIAMMERHQIRRVPVVDERGRCAGIIAQADVAWTEPPPEVGELVREVSRDLGPASR
jgi:CBS domain-containing protein